MTAEYHALRMLLLVFAGWVNREQLAAPIFVFVLSWFAWRTIRGFLHYQRLREVFFVLETAYTAFRGKYDLLKPPFDELPEK